MLVQEAELESDRVGAGKGIISIGSEIRIYCGIINKGFNMIRGYLKSIAVCSVTATCDMRYQCH